MSAQIDNKLDSSALETEQYYGINYVTAIDGTDISATYASTAQKANYDGGGNSLLQTRNNITALNSFVQTNSANWEESITVSNSGDLYKIGFDGVDLYGYKSNTDIPNYVYSAVSSNTKYSMSVEQGISFSNAGFVSLDNWSSFDIISITSNGSPIYPPEAGDYGMLTAFDVYFSASNLYDHNNEPLPSFSGYIGKITLDNSIVSSYFDKPSYFNDIARCDEFQLAFSGNRAGNLGGGYKLSVGKQAQSGTNTIEGIFVIPQSDLPTYEYDSSNKISAINGSALAGGSAPSDTFYIYPGKTTDKEISENSGKDLKLYNSANNVFLDFAGKSTLSNYTMFSFKEITGTQYNQNTVQHLRLRVYPNATSACKVYDTNTVNLLDSNSTVSTAQTAYYDSNGNYLSQTYDNLTALNQFVQSNSANWEGGGGSDVAPLGLWLGYMDSQVKAINNTNVPYSITLRNTNYGQPATVYFQGNYLEWNGTYGNWYIDLVNVLPNLDITDLPYNDSYDTKFTVMEFTNQSTQDKYSANITIDNGDNPYRYLKVYNNTACVVSANGAGASFNVDYIDGQGPHQLSSWTGGFYGVTGAFSNSQATAFNLSVAGYSTAFIGFVEAGSTVASGDVFPPTNNLDPYATYYLGWNANNGGLFWYQPGNN